MRTFRLLLTVSSMTAIAVGGLVACGDDDTNGTPSGVDSGASSSSSSSSSSSGSTNDGGGLVDSGAKPTAKATAAKIYLGQTASLDGSGSTGASLTYAWTLTAPVGSTVTTASLQGATTAKPTFVPDVLGSYTATLTVKSGADTATVNVTVDVLDAPVFFFAADENPSNAKLDHAGLRVTSAFGADGGAGAEVACFDQDAGASDNNALSNKVTYGASSWSDWWEAPAGQPSRAVFYWRTEEGGKHAGRLFAVTSDQTCGKAPTSLDVVADAEAIVDAVFEIPRISPNGQRVLYTKQDAPNHVRIATVGFDGTTPHNVADRQVLSNGTTDPDGGRFNGPGQLSAGARPSWIDDTTVAWLTKDDATHWQIVKASDADNSDPTVLMKCTGKIPHDFAVLPSGEVLVAQVFDDAVDANATAGNLYAYAIDAATKDCKTPRNLSKAISGGGKSNASGFQLSPDKTQVAYVVYDDQTTRSRIAVVAVDGATPPSYVGNGLNNLNSPRWIAGGTSLTWGVEGANIDGGGGTSQTAIAAGPVKGGSGGRAIVATSADRTFYAINSSTCSFGYGIGSAMSGFGFLGLLGLGITRRRNKKS